MALFDIPNSEMRKTLFEFKECIDVMARESINPVFVEFYNKQGEVIHINVRKITSVFIQDGGTYVQCDGRTPTYRVQGTIEEVLNKIDDARRNAGRR